MPKLTHLYNFIFKSIVLVMFSIWIISNLVKGDDNGK